jgi:hypothetical protein
VSESLLNMSFFELILSLIGDLGLGHAAGSRRSSMKAGKHAEDRYAGSYRGQPAYADQAGSAPRGVRYIESACVA